MITVRIGNTGQVQKLLAELTPQLTKTVILRLSQETYDSAQAGAGRHNKTGALFRSLYNRTTPTGRAVGHDTQAAPQAAFVNLGTKPHVIVPKKGKALRWPAGGKFAFAKRVNHPGYKGDAYLFRAADDAVRQFTAIVDDAFRRST